MTRRMVQRGAFLLMAAALVLGISRIPAPAPEPETPAGRVPIVGTVAAGSPILAQECIEDYLTFDTNGREGEYFALRVRGESMLNAGILPGDLVVVHQQQEARNGGVAGGRGHGEAAQPPQRRGVASAGERGVQPHRRAGGLHSGQGHSRRPPVLRDGPCRSAGVPDGRIQAGFPPRKTHKAAPAGDIRQGLFLLTAKGFRR